ncbi:MAG TPA: pyruvate kinase [Solirubrobacterales bacterium]
MGDRQTKIVATVGPASRDPETLEQLVAAGVDVFRLDLADSVEQDQSEVVARIRAAAQAVGGEVAILADLPRVSPRLGRRAEWALSWVDFAVARGVDILGVPFVASAADLAPTSARLAALHADIPLLAKIDRPTAVRRIDDILAACDGIVVAREDLGLETELSGLPMIQKRLIRAAGNHSKPSVTMSQMLGSMVTSKRPTRAEATDVANAIYDGTDALMLCEETATGAHPVDAVRVMNDIARATEPDLPRADWLLSRTDKRHQDIADAVAQSAVGAVYRLGLKALVVPTTSGRTARLVSAHRPSVPVLAVSPSMNTVRRLGLLSGVTATLGDEATDTGGLLDQSALLARTCGVAGSGDLVGITGGLPGHGLGTNLFGVQRVP